MTESNDGKQKQCPDTAKLSEKSVENDLQSARTITEEALKK